MDRDCFIRKNSEYQKVYKAKKISSCRYITLFTKKNNLNIARAGFTTTKKIGNACKRNFVRRRFKAIYRDLYPLIYKGYDYVFVAKKDAVDCDFKDLKKDFLNVLKRQRKVKNWKIFVCF